VGPENSNGPLVAYIDGQSVKISYPLPEIVPDYSAGGVSAEEASTAMAGLSMTMEVTAIDIRAFINVVELASAVNFARALEPAMVHRYLHTKKKRTRKKYEKRIRAWFREVFR